MRDNIAANEQYSMNNIQKKVSYDFGVIINMSSLTVSICQTIL
jgi:hypothetical protein